MDGNKILKGQIMKTYKLFTEGIKKWRDVKNPHAKREAGKMLKALDTKEVLAYSVQHGEFSKFKDEEEYKKALKGSKGRAMKWVKVEGQSISGQELEEAFNFKHAVKHGFLHKTDEKYVKDLKKKGWDIHEFVMTSKGFEIVIKKGSKKMEYSDKLPEKALMQAAKKVR